MTDKQKLNKKYQRAAARAGGSDISRIELKEGTNIVRLVSGDFEESFSFFTNDTEGNLRRINMTADKAVNQERYAIAYENITQNPSHRYFFKAIDSIIQEKKMKDGTKKKVAVLDNQVKLWEVGPMIFKQIADIQMDDEYPDVDAVNLKVKKTGKKMNTEYQVLPATKATDLPEDLVDEIDIQTLAEPTPLKQVYEIFGEEYGDDDEVGDDADVEEEEPKKPRKRTAKKPEPEPEEDEDVEIDDDEDDEPEEEEEAPKKPRKRTVKKKSEPEDEEDEDEDDEDIDDLDLSDLDDDDE